MDKSSLIKSLKQMYQRGLLSGEGVAMIHLFGIKNADYLKDKSNDFLIEISVLATGKSSYSTEIRKGVKLAKFVISK